MNRTLQTPILLLALLPAALAQTPAPPTQPLLVTRYIVKPNSTASFEEAQKKISEANRKAGREFYMVFRTSLGARNEYIVLTSIPGLEAFDGPAPSQTAYGDLSAHINRQLNDALESSTRQIWHMHPDMNIVSAQDFKIARVTEIALRNRAAISTANAIDRKLRAEMKKAGRKNAWLLHLDYGGDDYRSLYITPFDNYADLKANGSGSLDKLVGAEEAKKITAAREEYTRFRSVYIWSYRPELSFRNLPNASN
jgi:hypothetical protein